MVDSREQHPYTFDGIRASAKLGGGPLVLNITVAGLRTGDYSLDGLEERIAIERKSLQDAYGTIGGGRERFERELQRMAEMDYAAIVIESSLGNFVKNPPLGSQLSPKAAYRSLTSWSIEYGVHVWFCDDRFIAERTTFRLLDKFWRKEIGEYK